jgi:hypothetical protein
LALFASFTSPALAVAHGVAHAHGAEEHRGPAHDDAPAQAPLNGHETGRAHADEHAPDHGSDHDEAHDSTRLHDEGSTILREQSHGHRHDHARVETGTTGKPDVRSLFETPVLDTLAPPVLPQATHERSPVSRWDIVTLARPAPSTGPPPALRAPPVR